MLSKFKGTPGLPVIKSDAAAGPFNTNDLSKNLARLHRVIKDNQGIAARDEGVMGAQDTVGDNPFPLAVQDDVPPPDPGRFHGLCRDCLAVEDGGLHAPPWRLEADAIPQGQQIEGDMEKVMGA
jgi:hypothetical protein